MQEKMNEPSPTEDILGYPVSTLGVSESIEKIVAWLDSGLLRKTCMCANPHSLVTAQQDLSFGMALRAADLLTPDGIGMVLASRFLGGSLRERVTGSDIFFELSMILNRKGGVSYFFLGSTERNLRAIERKMAGEFPHISFAGAYPPPYRETFDMHESETMIEMVNAAAPDILWVGMTAPKQEKWIFEHRDRLNVRFIGAIGAVFDFYTGNIKRSPMLFRKLGLEWLPRLVREPRRLFKRNFVSSPVFLVCILRQKFR